MIAAQTCNDPPGQRIYPDGNGPGYCMPWHLRLAAGATLLAYMAWLYVLGGLILLAPFSRAATAVLAGVCATVLLPTHPILWRSFIHSPLFKLWRLYFNYSFSYESRLDDTKHYLYADYPHGVFPLSQLLGLTVRHRTGWRGERFYGLAADCVFYIPLWRHVMSWLGILPASAENLKRCLKWGCAGVTPGGIAEMYLASPDTDHIYIKRRKGFVRIAVETGSDIVPVYHLGNTQLFSFGPKFCERLARKFRFSLGLLYGVAGLPIPRRHQLFMVVGSPVPVVKTAKDDPAFDCIVEDTHRRYMEATQALYDKWKGEYGWDNHQLVMH